MFFALSNANAASLVCKGDQKALYWAKDFGQRAIEVDCSNRKKVEDSIKNAWLAVRTGINAGKIRPHLEELCWKAFNDVKELNKLVPIDQVAPIHFSQCNMAFGQVE